MREIKFRAWDKNNNFEIFTFDNMRVADYLHKKSKPYILINGGPVDLNDCVIEQFTGLHDKNGKEIYDGDLCLLYNPYDGLPAIGCAKVVFSYDYIGGWVLTFDGIEKLNIGSRTQQIEIIGNIHKNPELLS